MISDNKDKIKEDEKTDLESKISALKEALKGQDLAQVKTKAEELATVAQKIGAAMYQATSAQGQTPGQPEQAQEAKETEDDEQKTNG